MSVLETPRIYFKGEISWDPITTNNYDTNYDEDTSEPIYPPVPSQIILSTRQKVRAFRQAAITQVASLQNWNPHGTHRSTLFNTTLCGFDLGQGLQTDDPFIGAPVNLSGMLVDVEPYGGFTSQLFFDRMVFGVDGGYRILAPRTARFTDRYVNMNRTTFPAYHAGIASVCWQSSFAKADGLRIDAFDSAALQELAAMLESDDVLGLTVRFNTYSTVYYQNPNLTNTSPAARLEAERLIGKLNQGGFQPNPSYSLLVGVVGLWRRSEPAHEPGDRVIAQVPGSTLGTVFARANRSNLVLDLSNSVRETDQSQTKEDLGPLTVVAVDPLTQVSTVLGSIDYSQYDRDAYLATAGMITLPLPAGAEQILASRNLEIRSAASTPLASEINLRLIPSSPNLYLDQGDNANATFQLYDRGVSTAISASVTMYQFDAEGNLLQTLQMVTNAFGELALSFIGTNGRVDAYVPSLGAQDDPKTNGLNPQVNTFMYLRVRPADGHLAALPPTWTNVYARVLANWNAMAPCMDNWLRLDNPAQVKAFAPLLKQLTDPANFESYRFMPVTRDMSKGERALLYGFLDSPQEAIDGLTQDAIAASEQVPADGAAADPRPTAKAKGSSVTSEQSHVLRRGQGQT